MIEYKHLQKITNFDQELIIEMLKEFNFQLKQLLEDLKIIVDKKDWQKLKDVAHKLKSSCALLKVDELAGNLNIIENKIIDKRVDPDLRNILKETERLSKKAISEIEGMLKILR